MGVVSIEGDSSNGWMFLYNNVNFLTNVFTNRKSRIVLFGSLGENDTITCNDTLNMITYTTENELEIAVDDFVNESGYYKSEAESFNPSKFSGESGKYPVVVPNPSPEIE